MNRIEKFNNSYLKVKVEVVNSEKLINYLLKNGAEVSNVTKDNLYSVEMNIRVSDYHILKSGVKKLGGKFQVLDRRGLISAYPSIKRRKLFFVGIVLFFVLIFYLSRFIWNVSITTDKYLAPLEVRNLLKSYGIGIGTKKDSIDVIKIEEQLVKDIDEIMWVKVRIEGSNLEVKIVERQEPPAIKKVEYTGDMVAGKRGVVDRVYATAGTPVAKGGDVVSEGDLLIKGQAGKEGKEYSIKAEGRVFATTFYEEIMAVPKTMSEKQFTGRVLSAWGINLGNKSFYIKKPLNNTENYDKIEYKWGIFIKESYKEFENKTIETDTERIIKELENKITLNLDRGAKILNTVSDVTEDGDQFKVRVMVTAEEDIAKSQEVVQNEESGEETPGT